MDVADVLRIPGVGEHGFRRLDLVPPVTIEIPLVLHRGAVIRVGTSGIQGQRFPDLVGVMALNPRGDGLTDLRIRYVIIG